MLRVLRSIILQFKLLLKKFVSALNDRNKLKVNKKMKKVEVYLAALTYCIDNEWNKYLYQQSVFLISR